MAVTEEREDVEADLVPTGTPVRAHRRRWVAAIVAVLLLVGGVAMLRGRTYTSTAIIQLDPIQLDELLVPDLPAPAEDDAYAAEIERILGPEIKPQVDDQVAGEFEMEVEPGPGSTLVVRTRADEPAVAQDAGERLVATYVTNRQQGTGAEAALQGTLDQLRGFGVDPPETAAAPPGTPEDVVAQIAALQGRIAAQQEAIETIQSGSTAVVLEEPEVDLGAALLPLLLIGLGLAVGIAALVLVVRDDDRRRGIGTAAPAPAKGWADHVRDRVGRPVSRRAIGALGALVVARALVYGLFGVGFMADDWLIRANLEEYGIFGTSDGLALSASSLPGAWVSYNVVFWLAGDHPVALLVIGTVLNLVLIGLLYVLLDRLFNPAIALGVTAVWVILPNHSSLTVWASTVQARQGLILLLGGLLLLLRGRDREWLIAGPLLAIAALSYELTVPFAVLGTLLLPSRGSLGWRRRAVVLAFVAAAWLWLRQHPHYPLSVNLRNPFFVWSGHFGGGLLGSITVPVQLRLLTGTVIAVAVVTCLVLWALGDRRWDAGPALVGIGLAMMALGYVTMSSNNAALDATETGSMDRLFSASSIGSAFVLVGIGLTIYQRRRRLAIAGAAVLVAIACLGTVSSARTWALVTDQAEALGPYLGRVSDDPANTRFVVTPDYPWFRGVTGHTTWTASAMLHQRYGPGEGYVTMLGDHTGPIEADEVVVDWSEIEPDVSLDRPPNIELSAVWRTRAAATRESACAAITLVTGDIC